MPTIVKLGNIAIRMFAKDHNPPHLHIVTPDHQALVSIETLELLRGSMDRRSLEIALEWAAANREILELEWNRLND
jgi:hypothetical protein